MSDLLRQLGHRARARDADVRRLETSRTGDAGLVDPEQILSALGAQREAELRASAGTTRAGKSKKSKTGVVVAVAATLAMAAAVALAVRVGPEGEAAPDYVVSVSGRVETMRSAHGAPRATLEARDDSMQEVLLRPREAAGAKVAASVLLVREGARVPTDLAPEVSDLGAVRFDVPGPLLHGATALVVVLASPDTHRTSEIRIPVDLGAEKK